MCRFVYYQGPPIYLSALLTEPEHSLIRQSVHAQLREEPLNGDGFGVGWYQDPPEGPIEPDLDRRPPDGGLDGDRPGRDVGRFRSITPAWSNQNLEELARVVRSSRILAHVRAASPGSVVSETNSHPFRAGPLLFMHNGDIGGFRRLRREILDRLSHDSFDGILGSTDSEHFFGLVRDELLAEDRGDDPVAWMAGAFRRALRTILALRRELAPDHHIHLNVVLTDGRTTLVSRFTTDVPEKSQSLFLIRGAGYECRDGACVMVPEDGTGDAVLVSSEPLSGAPGWRAVEPDTLLLIDPDGKLREEPVDA
jgi:glutamine amidotransferase